MAEVIGETTGQLRMAEKAYLGSDNIQNKRKKKDSHTFWSKKGDQIQPNNIAALLVETSLGGGNSGKEMYVISLKDCLILLSVLHSLQWSQLPEGSSLTIPITLFI